ncbi:MAG: autotransporter-associated beta strand repeat-containing protein [Verrucomicrobiota bacterium]
MKKTFCFGLLLVLSNTLVHAATNYWDINGATAGAGGATPAGAWTSAFWSTNSAGNAATGSFASGDSAVFSAGTDATGAFTVSGNATAASIVVEEGTVTISGTITLGAGSLAINSGAVLSTSSSIRISATAGSVMTINGGTARTTNTGAAGSFVDVDQTIVLNGGGTIDYTVANVLNIISGSTVISGTGPLTKSGVGVIAIATACTYSGATIINNGELRIRTDSNRLPTGTDVTINSPGILNLNRVTGADVVGQQIGSLSGNGLVGLSGSILVIGGSANTTFSGAIQVTANAGATGSTGTGGSVTKQGAGILTLTGTNTFTSLLTLSAGGIIVAPTGFLADPVCDVAVNGGTLTLSNAAQTVENLYGTGGTINLTAGHTLTVNSINTSGLRGTTYAGVITGPGNIIKTGALTESFLGANTYTGSTTINVGKLFLSTTSTGAGVFSVADNAGLGVTVTSPGTSLNISDLTLGNSTTEFDFAALGYPSTKMANVTGTLNVNGTVAVNARGFTNAGTATLLEYVVPQGGLGNFALGVLPPRINGTLTNDTTNGKVTLNTTGGDSLIWVGDASGNWTVNDVGNPTWRLVNGATAAEYQETAVQGDVVRFDDTATGTTTIAIPVAVSPYKVITIDNSALNYSFSGSGKISGLASLVKNGTSQLTLATTNDYSGGTTLNSGIVNVGSSSPFGTGKLTINSGVIRSDTAGIARTTGTNSVDLSGNVTLGDSTLNGDLTLPTGPWTIKGGSQQITVDTINATLSSSVGQDVSGRGLTKAGSGTLNLTGANTFSGGFNHNGGRVRINSTTGLGAASSLVTLADGVALSTSAGTARTLTYAWTLNGNVTLGQSSSGTAALTLAGILDLGASTREITLDNLTDTISASITNSGGIMVDQNNMSVSSGTVTAVGAGYLASSTTVTFDNSGTGGSGAAATVTTNAVDGSIATIVISNFGSGYTNAPTITISGVGAGAAGTVAISSKVLVLTGAANTYAGSTTISNGTIQVNATSTLGNGAGTLNLSGGTLQSSAARTVATANPVNLTTDSVITTTSTAASANFEFSNNSVAGTSGTLTFRSSPTTGTFKPRFSGSGFNFTRPIGLANVASSFIELNFFNTTGTAQTFSGIISGSGSVRRSASTAGTGGQTIFTEANTYSGGTSIGDGALVVNNTTGSGTGSGAVTLTARGTLAGNGTVSGAVSGTGSIAPGTSVGTLTLGNGLDLSAGGTNVWELAANTTSGAGTSFDQISLTGGNLVLGGTSRLRVSFIGTATFPDSSNPFWQVTHTWQVISLSGTAANLSASAFSGVDGASGNNAGYFTNSVDLNGNVFLTFIPRPVPQPVIESNISGAGTTSAILNWSAVDGVTYQVQYKNDLNAVNWSVLGSVTASGSTASITDTTDPVPASRFYRIVYQ